MKKLVTPEYISDLVNFGPDINREWVFDSDKNDMRNAQAKGAAHLYNLLCKHKVALLADEVGMGKTIQALSVCAALWREKPDARVLIIAPREVVAKNWQSEYNQFIKNHYRLRDNVVKSELGDNPVNEMVYCHNLFNLTHNVTLKWPKLLIAKTTSFSTLVSYSDVINPLKSLGIKMKSLDGTKEEKNKKVCQLLRKRMNFNDPIFDLLIIDEAHYFRNSKTDTLRTNTAKNLFGIPDIDIPMAKQVLLMTATPNHSSSDDIKNILSYFTSKFEDQSIEEILSRICVRRLRRLSNKGVTKYGYRKEVDLPANFDNDPLGELFFGMYHYELVRMLADPENTKLKNRRTNNLRAYLEGTEFIPDDESEILTEGPEDEEGEDGSGSGAKTVYKDESHYSVGEDRNILISLSKKFKDNFGGAEPHHPKYDALLSEIKLGCKDQKAVIFVRRIPSVYEINRRMITELDNDLWGRLRSIRGLENIENIPSRDKFKSLLRFIKEDDELIEEEAQLENNNVTVMSANLNKDTKHIKKSEVLDYFVLKKDRTGDKIKVDSTPAANFKLRFDPNKTSPFAIFFSPGPFYDEMPYTGLELLKFDSGKKKVLNYYESALNHRLNTFKGWQKVNRHFINRRTPAEGKSEILVETIPTFFTLFWLHIKHDPKRYSDVFDTYESFSVVEQEALCKFVGEGLLSGSSFIVDLFVQFIGIAEKQKNRKPDALSDYLEFCESCKPLIQDESIIRKVCDSILNFKSIYRKVFNIQSEADLFNEDWNDFTYMNVYPFSAKNKNQSILNSFNTPFYPDYLVATSVLQEGVNLQYFCDKLFHYGAAWTPGDNEQRNGRVDRMFGLIERRLNTSNHQQVTLNLYYPYLKNSVDETNLSKFFREKHISEKLIDEGKGIDQSILNVQEEDPSLDWKNYLRKTPADFIQEPFKVGMDKFAGIRSPDISHPSETINAFLGSIKTALNSISEFEIEITTLGNNVSNGFVADPFLPGSRQNRRQPVIVELLYDSIGSSLMNESVYTLRMKTPLERSLMWKQALHKISEHNLTAPEIVKLCLDNKAGRGNKWGLYLRADLPLFTQRKLNNPLSIDEIKESFKRLVIFSDQFERLAFRGQDLIKSDLNLTSEDFNINRTQNILSGSKGMLQRKHWRVFNQYCIFESKIECDMDMARFCLERNHVNNYLCYSEYEHGLRFTAFLFAKDATEAEYNLLESFMNQSRAQVKFEINLSL